MIAILSFIKNDTLKLFDAVEYLFDLKQISSHFLKSKNSNIAILPINLLENKEITNWLTDHFHSNLNFKIILTYSSADTNFLMRNSNSNDILQKNNISNQIPQSVILVLNSISIFKIISEDNSIEIHETLFSALEEDRRSQQKIQMESLILDQNKKLLELQKSLSDHIEKRQKFLTDSRSKLFETNHKQQIISESLLVILKSTSLHEIEKNLTLILSKKLDIAWVRIIFKPQDISILQTNAPLNQFYTFIYPMYEKTKEIGSIVFFKNNIKNFTKDDKNTITKICEAIQMSLDRINKLELTQDLKQQWEVTFNAITQPLILVDTHYDLLQFNKSFSEASISHLGKKCYEKFFNRSSPCENCKLGTSFSIETHNHKLYNIQSSPVNLKPTHTHPVFVNYYQDVTEDKILEKQIIEKSKKAEIGTISSSIAHELNNPLGGILSFLQLIKMDLNKNSPFYSDIDEMEKGVHRCKDIILNLLNFTHKESQGPKV